MLIELAPVVGYGSTAIYLATPDHVESESDAPTSTALTSNSAGSHRIGTVRLLTDLHDTLTALSASGDLDIDVDVRTLNVLARLRHAPQGLDDDSVTLDDVNAVDDAVRSLLRTLRKSGTEAIGLVDTSPAARRPGLLRSWPEASDHVGLAHRRHAAVRQRGLHIDLHYSDGQLPIEDIRSFSLGADGGVVDTAAGESFAVDRDMTRALCDVADGATAWRVRTVPSVLVWAGLLEGLETAAESLRESFDPALIMVSDELARTLYISE